LHVNFVNMPKPSCLRASVTCATAVSNAISRVRVK
jgi:hypothetical protein